mgnify:CR=1 FL=1
MGSLINMKKYLFIVLLVGVCLGQAPTNDWIYYNNISDHSVVPTMVRPDGSDSTSLADSSITFLHDVNETGTKFLYGNGSFYASGSNLILQHGNSIFLSSDMTLNNICDRCFYPKQTAKNKDVYQVSKTSLIIGYTAGNLRLLLLGNLIHVSW